MHTAVFVGIHVLAAGKHGGGAGQNCDGCKGENRLASRPAVIVEIAYMDRPVPDNDALHDDAFKRIVAQAIREAVQEWTSIPER